MATTTLESDFPGLPRDGYRVTSPPDLNYNCLAWVLGDNCRWWEPSADGFWPGPEEESFGLEPFVAVLESHGFKQCESAETDENLEKVALFASGGEITHASRQLPSGKWTSKLGSDVDLEHSLHSLEGAIFGTVAQVLSRPIRDSSES